jgi:hypothetical protein
MSAKKKPDTQTPAAAPSIVTVEVINQPLYEADARRSKGERFELPRERAEVLRAFVKIIELP